MKEQEKRDHILSDSHLARKNLLPKLDKDVARKEN